MKGSQIIVTVLLFIVSVYTTNAEISLPSLISDNMVIQQGKPVHIWGNANVDEKVTVSLLNQSQQTIANKDGKWQVWLHPMEASNATSMTISGKNTITIKNILIGEVWFAAGQSNMEWSVKKSNNSEEEIANADYPQIRFFDAQRSFSDTIKSDIVGKWVVCSPETVAEITGGGYFFARGLHHQQKVAVGLIDASWGATRCEAWTPEESYNKDPRLMYWQNEWDQYQRDFPQTYKKYKEDLTAWELKAEKAKEEGQEIPKKPREPKRKNKNQPSSIYNAVVAPISFYTIRGVIWYQGENNAYEKQSYLYRYLFPEMILAWRKAWGQGDFPFIYAQLSTLWKHPYWPVLRESQTEALKLYNTAMIATYDIGDSTDAHFKNKQSVGKRFELAARKLVYGDEVVASGPVFRQVTIEGNKLRIWFDHGKGLKASGGNELVGFEIAGNNGQLMPADAEIDGETIVLSNKQIKNPVIARYAFKDAVIGNLINGAGLPAVPFRNDVSEIP
ncbi:sialate O-acetylesterase [Plebeiibacterium marinum]|uniref:Sialate O-acetylesterase n=1 Tax=Plebeiibacterium marinum TaxID=2992111 RepID=A0AAE3SLN6_9BACT|nr:sialate O-acetylesterase [Plebeiobacterium marinum]MCW3807907.1 sialate O-acetylesterase [Plebeiobacterium marinum]